MLICKLVMIFAFSCGTDGFCIEYNIQCCDSETCRDMWILEYHSNRLFVGNFESRPLN